MNLNEQDLTESNSVVAAGIALYSCGDILLGKITGSNGWTIFKGKREDGERLVDTARRELFEESNIQIDHDSDLNIKPIHTYVLQKQKKLVIVFLVIDQDGKIRRDADLKCNSFWSHNMPEICDYRWVPIDELHKYLIKSQLGLIDVLKKELKKEK